MLDDNISEIHSSMRKTNKDNTMTIIYLNPFIKHVMITFTKLLQSVIFTFLSIMYFPRNVEKAHIGQQLRFSYIYY